MPTRPPIHVRPPAGPGPLTLLRLAACALLLLAVASAPSFAIEKRERITIQELNDRYGELLELEYFALVQREKERLEDLERELPSSWASEGEELLPDQLEAIRRFFEASRSARIKIEGGLREGGKRYGDLADLFRRIDRGQLLLVEDDGSDRDNSEERDASESVVAVLERLKELTERRWAEGRHDGQHILESLRSMELLVEDREDR